MPKWAAPSPTPIPPKMKALLALLALATLLSCGTSQQNYYLLSPSGPAPSRPGMGIGVGPVDLNNYLDKPQLVFQGTANSLEINDLHQWAGDLSSDFASVLATNLGRRKNTGNLQTYPWGRDTELDYQVTINVTRFHGTNTGDAVLEASWRIYKFPGSIQVTARTSNLREPLRSDGFDELAAAQSRLVDQLAAEIASFLR